MRFFLLICLAFIAVSMAFMPSRVMRAKTSNAMSMKMEMPKLQNIIPAALLPLAMPMATIAAEGTGRAFGVDDSRLVWAALLPSLIIFPLYSKWSSQQEKDDFFGGYEKRRQG